MKPDVATGGGSEHINLKVTGSVSAACVFTVTFSVCVCVCAM